MSAAYSLSAAFRPNEDDSEKQSVAKQELADALSAILDPCEKASQRKEILEGRFCKCVHYHSRQMLTLAQPIYEALHQVAENENDPIQKETKAVLKDISLHDIIAPFLTAEQLIAQGVLELQMENDVVNIREQVEKKSRLIFSWYQQNKQEVGQLLQMKQELDRCIESSDANWELIDAFNQNAFDAAFSQQVFYIQMNERLKVLTWSLDNTN